MDYVYIFNHIPKCAGNTLRFALKEWFEVKMDYQQQGWSQDKNQYSIFVKNPLDLSQLKPNTLVAGHYCVQDSFLSQRYPQVYNQPYFHLITIVRDPLLRLISLYNFVERNGRKNPDDTLEKFLLNHKNGISRILECNNNNYKEVIGRYYFVGVQEKLQESLNLLADKLNKPQIDLTKYSRNIAPKSQQTPSLSEAVIEKFQENNSLDYKIVNYCNEILQFNYTSQEEKAEK